MHKSEKSRGDNENKPDQGWKELQEALSEEEKYGREIDELLRSSPSREDAEKEILKEYGPLMKQAMDRSRSALNRWLKKEGIESASSESIKKPKKGLGREKNIRIFDLIRAADYNRLLQLIRDESDKHTACEVIVDTISAEAKNKKIFVDNLLITALSNLNAYGDSLKELIVYTYKNCLHGERFWKNPYNNQTLFVDDDGEIISFEGEVSKSGVSSHITYLGRYQVLTGPNKGKFFDGSLDAMEHGDKASRPIRGPRME